MYTSHYDDFYIFFCKAGCEVNKQANKLGASSPCHLCDKGMSLSTLSSWLNTVITRSSLATMVCDVTNYFIAYRVACTHSDRNTCVVTFVCVSMVPGKCLNKILMTIMVLFHVLDQTTNWTL